MHCCTLKINITKCDLHTAANDAARITRRELSEQRGNFGRIFAASFALFARRRCASSH